MKSGPASHGKIPSASVFASLQIPVTSVTAIHTNSLIQRDMLLCHTYQYIPCPFRFAPFCTPSHIFTPGSSWSRWHCLALLGTAWQRWSDLNPGPGPSRSIPVKPMSFVALAKAWTLHDCQTARRIPVTAAILSLASRSRASCTNQIISIISNR